MKFFPVSRFLFTQAKDGSGFQVHVCLTCFSFCDDVDRIPGFQDGTENRYPQFFHLL